MLFHLGPVPYRVYVSGCESQPPPNHWSASAKPLCFGLHAPLMVKKKMVNCRFKFNWVLTMLGQAQGKILWKEAMIDAV